MYMLMLADMRFEVLIAVSGKIMVFGEMTSYILVDRYLKLYFSPIIYLQGLRKISILGLQYEHYSFRAFNENSS
jgi:hypothetical protein